MTNEIIVKRLAIIKYLFNVGLEQCKQPEIVAYSSILSFHDSIDMFMQLAAEKKGIAKREREKSYMMSFFSKIPELTLEASVNKINVRRNSLKHNGQIPAKIEIEESKTIAALFFEQNTPTIFGIEFKEISLVNLVSYESAKEFLDISQKAFDEARWEHCVENAAYAFHELLDSYENNKINDYRKSPFFFGDKMPFWWISHRKLEQLDRDLADNINKLKNSLDAMSQALKITTLGIDYRKYAMFSLLTPTVRKDSNNKYHASLPDEKKWTKENCKFCIDFVIESSLKLQEFDFNIEHLIDDDPPQLEYVSGDFKTGMFFREVPKKKDD